MSTTKVNTLGEQAMQIISDYPLYASTSNVTYEEAIEVAKIVVPINEWTDYIKELQNA